ncbi:MAG: DUF948 domain-containing protein [Melioribacteraceae bacterium]|nr:DUF948 domain-containing protein [Melioribacteraceae bacterium]
MLEIFLIILSVAATILCVYLILVLKKIVLQIEQLNKDIKELVDNTIPVLKNINDVTLKANRIVSSAEDYWDGIERSIENVRYKFSRLTGAVRNDSVENPAGNFIQNIKALSRGISAFWQEFRK